MKYQQVVDHFDGPTKVAKALGIENKQTVHNWQERKRIPTRWQIRLATLSGGKLKPDREAKAELAKFLEYADSAS